MNILRIQYSPIEKHKGNKIQRINNQKQKIKIYGKRKIIININYKINK